MAGTKPISTTKPPKPAPAAGGNPGRGVPAKPPAAAQANTARRQSSAQTIKSAARVAGTASTRSSLSRFPAGKMFAAEFIVAVGINSWQAIKAGQVPFPGTIIRTTAAFGILSLLWYVDDDLAALLGAGLLMALIVKQASGGFEQFAAKDPADGFFYLTFKGSGG